MNTFSARPGFLITVWCLLLISCASPQKEQKRIRVFAAASLGSVMADLSTSFEATYGTPVTINLASSGTLARQIEQGAEADVFISANEKWTNYLHEKGKVDQVDKLKVENQLVLIAPSGSTTGTIDLDKLTDLTGLKGQKLAIGNPGHVPLGTYSLEAMTHYDWSQEDVLYAKDARATLMVVELAEVPMGIVYLTDAEKSDKVEILGTFPSHTHQPISYFAGQCSKKTVTEVFLSFLDSAEARPIWRRHGFKS